MPLGQTLPHKPQGDCDIGEIPHVHKDLGDQRYAQPVLHAASRIEVLQFGEQADAIRSPDAPQLKEWRIPDQILNGRCNLQHDGASQASMLSPQVRGKMVNVLTIKRGETCVYVRAFAVTPGLKHSFTGRQLVAVGVAVGEDAIVELTTFQQLLVQMPVDRVEAAREELHAAGMKTYAVGAVVKNVRACSFCQGDDVEGYDAAVALDSAVAGVAVPFPMRVSYSGCTNGCADPLMHDIGVVKNGEGFDIYGGGRSSGLSPQPGTLVVQGIGEAEMPEVVRRIALFYQTEGKGRERFWKFVDRVGIAAITEAARSGPAGRQ